MRKPTLFTIFLVVFLDLVGFGIVLPLIPFLSREFQASSGQIGWIIASYSLAQFFFAPAWGSLSDRIGRRPVILISLAGSVLSYLLFALAPSLSWVLASRIFAGICGANISVATAYIADITPPEKRAKGMGLIGAAFGLGFIFGPLIGGSLLRYGFHCPGFTACSVSLIALLFALFALPESLPSEVRAGKTPRRYSLFDGWREALSTPVLIQVMLLTLLSNLAFAMWETTFGLFVNDRAPFHYSGTGFSYLLAYVGFVTALIQGGLIGRLVEKWGEKSVLLGGCAAMVLSFGMIPAAGHLAPLLAALALLGAGFAFIRPCTYSILSQQSSATDQGKVLGAAQAASSLTRVIGPVTGGFLYTWNLTVPFWTGTALMLLGACLVLLLPRNPAGIKGRAPVI